eukprot:TRINITY_DN1318_c0_g1_i2.p1 TRINITY_DN1318_c0_g1~~TRINITY_DN1318_c0_g1_i2.p1  ORF type:complete len:224 (-),score=15.97 TRINITY_DN1318_c0_g1_i2:66-737(-)
MYSFQQHAFWLDTFAFPHLQYWANNLHFWQTITIAVAIPYARFRTARAWKKYVKLLSLSKGKHLINGMDMPSAPKSILRRAGVRAAVASSIYSAVYYCVTSLPVAYFIQNFDTQERHIDIKQSFPKNQIHTWLATVGIAAVFALYPLVRYAPYSYIPLITASTFLPVITKKFLITPTRWQQVKASYNNELDHTTDAIFRHKPEAVIGAIKENLKNDNILEPKD